MKKTILILSLTFLTGILFAQKKTTTSATVSFDATTDLDKLPKADNNTVVAAVDTKTGAVQFEATVKNFAFSNPSIQEHFNGEKWLNSNTHPTFTFNGQIANPSDVNFAKDGTYKTTVQGTLTVKGVSKNISAPATVVIKDGSISATSNFTIKLADYGISGGPIESGKIAREPKVTVSAQFN